MDSFAKLNKAHGSALFLIAFAINKSLSGQKPELAFSARNQVALPIEDKGLGVCVLEVSSLIDVAAQLALFDGFAAGGLFGLDQLLDAGYFFAYLLV